MPSVVMAGFDPAIQCHTEFIDFCDGPACRAMTTGFCGRTDFSHAFRGNDYKAVSNSTLYDAKPL
jgi:hypothetical protein